MEILHVLVRRESGREGRSEDPDPAGDPRGSESARSADPAGRHGHRKPATAGDEVRSQAHQGGAAPVAGKQALVLADKARSQGDEAKAADFEETAQALA